MNSERFSSRFISKLNQDGYKLTDIVAEAEGTGNRLQRTIRSWTGYTNQEIQDGFLQEDRDILCPKINQELQAMLTQWISQCADNVLPTIEVKQIARRVSAAPQRITRVLLQYPFTFSLNGILYKSDIQSPEFPTERVGIEESSSYRVSPKKITRDARYLSRSPGGGPVEKAGLQNASINSLIRSRAWQENIIRFKPVIETEMPNFGVMEELLIPTREPEQSVEHIFYQEPNGQQLMNVFNWFKESGDKNWVYKGKERTFAQQLVNFSRKERVDFNFWNCIGFSWIPSSDRGMPMCNITDNLDAAITLYFQQRILDIATQLSTIGDPTISILVPSNEAFDERVWRYIQPKEVRNNIINSTVEGLQTAFKNVPFPKNVTFSVLRWDEYLPSRGIFTTPEEYSLKGKTRLLCSENVDRILDEAVRSGGAYFAQNGIRNIPKDILRNRELDYYGVYAGEGIAYTDIKKQGIGTVSFNFEEMRVSQMEFIGSEGNLCIVTPATTNEIIDCYRWEAQQIAKRL